MSTDYNSQAPTLTATRSRVSLQTILSVVLLVVVAATAIGGFGAVSSYSAIVGSDIFKAAAGKGNGGGGGKGMGKGPDKPALEVSLSNEITPQTVVAGTKAHVFAKLILDASALSQNILVSEVNFTAMADSQANPAEFSNFSIFDGNTELATSNDPDSDAAAKTVDGSSATIKFTFVDPVEIQFGTSKILTVKADISNAAIDGSLKVGIFEFPKKSKVNVVEAANSDGQGKLDVSYQYNDGPETSLVRSGRLSITQDASTPDSMLFPANSSAETITVLRADASYEDIRIEKLYITGIQVNGGGWDQVDTLYLFNGATQVTSVTPTTTDGVDRTAFIDITNNPIIVPKGGNVKLIFKVDTPELNNGEGLGLASSYQGIQLAIKSVDDVTAKGVLSGTTLGSASKEASFAMGEKMYLVMSVPTISVLEATQEFVSPGSFPTTKEVHSFDVSASSVEAVGLFSVSYYIQNSGLRVTDVALYRDGTRVASAYGAPEANVTTGVYHFFLTDTGNEPIGDDFLPNESLILAGVTERYSLRANLYCDNDCKNSGGGSVRFQFLGDGSPADDPPIGANTLFSDVAKYQYELSMLWTDWWKTPLLRRASPTATVSEQWMNGYLIKNSLGNYLGPTSTGSTWYHQ